jgi:hypothetical protein
MRFLILALLAPLLLTPDCYAGWGSGGCAPVGAPGFSPVPEWEWRQTPDGSRADLYHFGRYYRSHYYEADVKPANPKKKTCDCCPSCGCGDDCRCPDGRPCGDGCTCILKGESFPRWMTHGTDPEKIAPREEYRVGGRVVTREEALKALQASQLTDDSRKLRLTVIGGPEECKMALAGLPAEVKERCLVKEYAPDHWSVKNAGFKTDGHPTVYVQAPDGKVLHRQDDADNVSGAVRKADPTYDPTKDPDLRKPRAPDKPSPPDNPQNSSAGWVVAGLVALAALLWKGPKS